MSSTGTLEYPYPFNSTIGTVMYSITRHEGMFNPKRAKPVIVVGCGATGSHIALQLFMLGIDPNKILVIDYDKVKVHNLSNQIFLQEHVNQSKVQALENYITTKMGYNSAEITLSFINNRVPEFDIRHCFFNDVVTTIFLCVDSMDMRQTIVNSLYTNEKQTYRIIDTRLAATHGNIYSFDFQAQKHLWEKTILSEDQIERSPCGAQWSVIPSISVLSGMAVWEYIHFCTNPDAMSDIIDFYLKPVSVYVNTWSNYE